MPSQDKFLPGIPAGYDGDIDADYAEGRINLQQRNALILRELGARDRDADGLDSGHYEYVDGQFRRIGPVGELRRYHGTIVPEGMIIKYFEPKYGNVDSRDRPSIGNTPAVYSTSNAEAALEYALGYNNFPQQQEGREGQLYALRIIPDEVVDLGDCREDRAARAAIKRGFDVIECPRFWEQPETITFDANKIKINGVYPVARDVPDDFETWHENINPDPDEQINSLKEEGFLGDSIYSPDHRMATVRTAVDSYRTRRGRDGMPGRTPLIAARMPQADRASRHGRGKRKFY